MFDTLGVVGVLGITVMLVGLAIIAWVDLVLAAGFALVLAGIGLVTRSLVRSALSAMGLGGAF